VTGPAVFVGDGAEVEVIALSWVRMSMH